MRPHSHLCRLVSFTLAVLVLITSVGFTVQRMTCRISGRSRVAVAVAVATTVHGCTTGREAATERGGCCDFSKQVHKLSHPVSELAAKILVPVPLLAVLPRRVSWPAARVAEQPALGGARWYAADSSPPPRGGRALLALACTLVV